MPPYTGGTRIPRLLGVRYYLNNYFANYTHVKHSLIRVELAFPAYWGSRNYVINYFAMYKRLMHSRRLVEHASPAYLGLGTIKIIILPCTHV